LDTLSPCPRHAYTAGGNNDDLALGNAHLVRTYSITFFVDRFLIIIMRAAIPHTKPAMYVALVVAQHRDKKGAISGIQNDALASAFRKIAAAAVRMKGVSLSVA